MSDSETVESSGEEEATDDLKEEEGTDDQKEEEGTDDQKEEYLIETGTMKGAGTMVTVITRNVKVTRNYNRK